MKLNDRIIAFVESYGFSMNEVEQQDDEFYVEIGQHTPCGEDWRETVWFDGTDEGFVKGVGDLYTSFDVDSEVEFWIDSRGTNGVPRRIRDLLEDAEWKESKLENLSGMLEVLKF